MALFMKGGMVQTAAGKAADLGKRVGNLVTHPFRHEPDVVKVSPEAHAAALEDIMLERAAVLSSVDRSALSELEEQDVLIFGPDEVAFEAVKVEETKRKNTKKKSPIFFFKAYERAVYTLVKGELLIHGSKYLVSRLKPGEMFGQVPFLLHEHVKRTRHFFFFFFFFFCFIFFF